MKLTNRIIYKGILALVLILFLTSCWDRQEIEERAVVLAIGIEEVGLGSERQEEEMSYNKKSLPTTSNDMIKVFLQIAVPGQIPLGPSSGGGGGGGLKTVWVVEDVGHTIDDAINNLQQRISAPLFFGHLRVILLSENLAKKGIENLNDYLRRNPEVRRLNWMLVNKGNVSDIMYASPKLERVPSIYLISQMDQAVKMGRFPNDFLGNFWASSSAKGREGYLPYVTLNTEDNIEINGLAYFKGNKMIGTINPQETYLYMGLKGMNPAGGQGYVKIPGTQEYVEFAGRSRKAVTKLRLENGRPHFSVKVYIEGNLREKSKDIVRLREGDLQQIEQELSKNLKKGYSDLIRKTQDDDSDIFGLGEYVRAKESKYWNQHIKTKEAWQQMYKDLDVEVTVTIHLRRIGMKAT